MLQREDSRKTLCEESVERFARSMAEQIVRSIQTETDGGSADDEGRVPAQTPPTLPRSGLPLLGSLDYPDAPPPTPLLPGELANRQSFTRKLKGGLAKEFVPSPPPPTPKDDDGKEREDDNDEELIRHLMRSLSTEDSGKIEAFAEALSLDVVKFARQEVGGKVDVELLATQMAKTIVKCSLDEAKHC